MLFLLAGAALGYKALTSVVNNTVLKEQNYHLQLLNQVLNQPKCKKCGEGLLAKTHNYRFTTDVKRCDFNDVPYAELADLQEIAGLKYEHTVVQTLIETGKITI